MAFTNPVRDPPEAPAARVRDDRPVPPAPDGGELHGPATARRILLSCGILSSLLHTGMTIFVPMGWEGYSSASQTISELSAIGAPTRSLWVGLGTTFTVLLIAFGWGVWRSAGGSRALRVVGGLLIAYGLIGLGWPPMHLRGTEFTLTDTLHIVWTAVEGVLALVAIGFAAAAFGRRFRIYSVATMVVLVVFAGLTGREAPGVAADLPTPWIGVWERVNLAAFLLWIAVLAVALLRANRERSARTAGAT